LFAAKEGRLELLQLLVEQLPADVHVDAIHDRHRLTALAWAAGQGQLACVEYLLGQGAEPNLANREGRTSLHWTCRNGHLEVLR
jgi:ankyrin repeat protein